MYVAIQHQLNADSKETIRTVPQLRKAAADFMRVNRDEFMPFMDNIENETQFLKYCQDVESTAAWGSQLEVIYRLEKKLHRYSHLLMPATDTERIRPVRLSRRQRPAYTMITIRIVRSTRFPCRSLSVELLPLSASCKTRTIFPGFFFKFSCAGVLL